MTRRRKMLPLAVIAILALGVTAGQTVAQEEDPAFEPRANGEHGDCRFGDRPDFGMRGMGPGFGLRGPGKGMMGPGGTGHPGAGLHMALRNLDLSESQREEIKAILEGERDQVEANHERMRALEAELREQIENDPFDEEAVRAKAVVMADLRVEMAVLRARQAGQVGSVLAPEQLVQLELMKEERRAFREERSQRFEQRRGRRPEPSE